MMEQLDRLVLRGQLGLTVLRGRLGRLGQQATEVLRALRARLA